MNFLIQILGVLLSLAFFVINLIWAETTNNDYSSLPLYFTTLTIYLPFGIFSLINKKADSYIKTTTIFFSLIATFASVIVYILINFGISFQSFWTLQIIIWLVVLVLVILSILSIKNVRG